MQRPSQKYKKNRLFSVEITKICQNTVTVIFKDYCEDYGDVDHSGFGSKGAK